MDDATGEAEGAGLRVAFDRRLKLEFHGATVTSDAGLLAFRELDDALGLTALAADTLHDPRTGKNGRHTLLAQFRQAVFGRLAGYEDVNDAVRLAGTCASPSYRVAGVSCSRGWTTGSGVSSDRRHRLDLLSAGHGIRTRDIHLGNGNLSVSARQGSLRNLRKIGVRRYRTVHSLRRDSKRAAPDWRKE